MEALTIISWISIALGILSAVIIYVDIQMGRYQPMTIMNIAWPATALFLWPVVLFMYFKYGRTKAGEMAMDMSHDHQHMPEEGGAHAGLQVQFEAGLHADSDGE